MLGRWELHGLEAAKNPQPNKHDRREVYEKRRNELTAA